MKLAQKLIYFLLICLLSGCTNPSQRPQAVIEGVYVYDVPGSIYYLTLKHSGAYELVGIIGLSDKPSFHEEGNWQCLATSVVLIPADKSERSEFIKKMRRLFPLETNKKRNALVPTLNRGEGPPFDFVFTRIDQPTAYPSDPDIFPEPPPEPVGKN